MPHLIIVRGLPGSGKSTYAKYLKDVGLCDDHFEADQFFIQDGEYKYDPSKREEAHTQCRDNVKQALCLNRNVVVSNTFTQHWEMEPYIGYAERNGIPFTVVEMNGTFGSVHNVPEEVLQRMKARWEPYEPAIKA